MVMSMIGSVSTVHVSGDKRRNDSGSYDVFVSEDGVRFEFGPRRMKVHGNPTHYDIKQFVDHVRFRNLARGTAAIPLVQKKPAVKVMGVRLG